MVLFPTQDLCRYSLSQAPRQAVCRHQTTLLPRLWLQTLSESQAPSEPIFLLLQSSTPCSRLPGPLPDPACIDPLACRGELHTEHQVFAAGCAPARARGQVSLPSPSMPAQGCGPLCLSLLARESALDWVGWGKPEAASGA